MKRTFQMLSAALLLTVVSVGAQAQGGGGGGGGMGRGGASQRTALFQEITLTPAQTASVDSIYTASNAKSMELRKDMQQGQPRDPALRDKMNAISNERNAAIKKVLTPEQVTQFDKNLANMPMGRGRGNS